MPKPSSTSSYWRDNLIVVSILLSIWFLVGYVCSIFAIEQLNQIHVGQIGLGFWIAQQGSIFVFILLVVAYAFWMDRLDRKHGVGEDQ